MLLADFFWMVMVSNFHVTTCALLALVLWSGIGWVITRRLRIDAALVGPASPIIGWAVHNVVALLLSLVVGFSIASTIGAAVLIAIGATLLPSKTAAISRSDSARLLALPSWIYLLAAVIALAPASAVMPKMVNDGIILAGPIFDHSKVALIDEMIRNGVPPANPFYSEDGGAGRVSYYYLWHFGAAQIAALTGGTGWEADIANSWFTGFASLSLIAGLAWYFSRNALASLFALIFSATASIRPVLVALFGEEPLHQFLKHGSGFAGWLFQMSWSPHHVAAGCCVLLSALLMAQLARQSTVIDLLAFIFISVAGFESSIWVGGITFAITASAIGLSLTIIMPSAERRRFLINGMIAAICIGLLSSPFVIEQIHAAQIRGGGLPVAIQPFPILGVLFPEQMRHILDIPAYWCVLLVIEFPLVFLPGLFGLKEIWRTNKVIESHRFTIISLTILIFTCLSCSWLLLSTVGDNNDLGWRAALPGLFALTSIAATAVASWVTRPIWLTSAVIAIAFLLVLPDTKNILSENIFGHQTSAAGDFANAPAMWAAVRKYTPTDARIANNPAYLQEITPWQINISWALLANRRSCFAGNELAIAFAPILPNKRKEIAAQFQRVFDGTGSPQDVTQLVTAYGCRVAVVTIQDGAWTHDAFAMSPLFHLADVSEGKWRIYVANDMTAASPPALHP